MSADAQADPADRTPADLSADVRAPRPLAVTAQDRLLARPDPVAPAGPKALRMVVNRQIRSGLMGGKRFELQARIEGERDLAALFKGYPDELVLAYKSVFSDKSHAVKRGDLVRGCRVVVSSLNEMIELEERLGGAFDQLRRMVEILETGERDVVTEG